MMWPSLSLVMKRSMAVERWLRSSELLLMVSFALGYFAAAEVGQALSVKPGNFATVWPPSGLYLAALLVTAPVTWPRLVAAAFMANLASDLLHGQIAWVGLSFWLANTVGAVIGASLLRWLFPPPFTFGRLKNTIGLVAVCGLISAPCGAIIGALTVNIAFGTAFSDSWLTWWIADLVGILLVVPLVFAFNDYAASSPARVSPWRVLEASLLVACTALASVAVFSHLPSFRVHPYLVYPLLLWGILRFGLRGGSGALAIVSVIALWFTLTGRGPFAAPDLSPVGHAQLGQLFLGVTATWCLILAAVMDERDHAARQLAEAYEAARKSEKELRDVIETMPTFAWTALPDGSIEFVNRHWREYTGLSAENSAGTGWHAAVHPEDVHRHVGYRLASFSIGAPFENEVRYRRAADGQYLRFLTRAVPLRDDRGNILKWYGISTEIDDRKRAEALLAGEKRILEMVARGDSLAHILDGLCRLVEEQAQDVLASVLLVDGDRLRHGGAPSLPKAYTDAIDGAVIGPCAGSCGTAAYRGAQVVVSDIATDPLWADYRELALPHGLRACWSTPIFSSEGKVIATFAMYYREPRSPSQRDQATIEQITHLAGVAIQSKRAEEAQRYHMQLLKTITDNASSMLYLVDATGRATFVNPAFERTTGYRAEEVIGQIVHDKIHHTKPDGTPYPLSECRLVEAVRQRRVLHGEELFVRKDGTFFPVQYTASPIFRDGLAIGTAIEVEDLTERRQAEQALHQAQTELAHVTRVMTMGEFTASIAHEVNQPLAAIVTNAQAALWFLDARPVDLSEVRQTLDAIRRDGRRAGDVIARIRSLVRKSSSSKVRIDLNEAIREVLAIVNPEARQHGIAVRTELAAGLPPVQGDRVQLQQVIVNLAVNGIEAMKGVADRRRELRIRSRPHEAGTVLVTVEDSGTGLDADSAERVFAAFYTTKPDGMGMGLAISRSIIEAHGGRLWPSAKSGRGATFQFTLPIADEDQHEAQSNIGREGEASARTQVLG